MVLHHSKSFFDFNMFKDDTLAEEQREPVDLYI